MINTNYKDELYGLIKELSEASVKYVVCGGVACVLQGVERTTYDLDIAVELNENNLKKVIKVAKKYKLIPRIPEPVENLLDENKRNEWIEKKNALVYTFVSERGPLQMDIFLWYPKSLKELFKNADIINVKNLKVLVASIDDLIYSKMQIKPLRDKDRIDIKELERLKNEKKENHNTKTG